MFKGELIGRLPEYSREVCFSHSEFMAACAGKGDNEYFMESLDAMWHLFVREPRLSRQLHRDLWFLTVCKKCLHLTHDCECRYNEWRSGVVGRRDRARYWLIIKRSVVVRLPILKGLNEGGHIPWMNDRLIERLERWAEDDFRDVKVGREAS